jgi:uncharacterized membrane protein HdeD (DUF308 family)
MDVLDDTVVDPGDHQLVRNWGLVALRGVAAIAFGLITILYPGIGLLSLVLLFGVYALLDGIFTVGSVLSQHRGRRHWVAALVGGLLSIVAGALAFFIPGITAFALVLLIAARALAVGVLEIATAIRLRKSVRNEWLLGLAGLFSIAFGVLVAMFPGAGALALVLWIGAYAIVIGVTLIALALRLRAWGMEHHVLGTT